MNYPEDVINKVIQGDAKEVLSTIPDDSVDCIITSPPYYGLRDYGVDGQIGLEKTPEEYVERLMDVFKECKRVLKSTGGLWLNIGDTYFGGGGGNNISAGSIKEKAYLKNPELKEAQGFSYAFRKGFDYQPKCMLMIPERIAFALIEDKWILRNKIIWYKRNHMPSSVRDRFANSWEYVYFLTKSKKYYFDLNSVREPCTVCGITDHRPRGILKNKLYPNISYNKSNDPHLKQYQGKFDGTGEKAEIFGSPRNERKIDNTAKFFIEKGSGGNVNLPGEHPLGKNPGDFWDITTKPFKEAHFAVFPEDLCIKPIKAGCPENGIVLDPFAGAGTSLVVAKELGRKYIGIELKEEYCKIAEKRLSTVPEKLESFIP